MTEEVSRKKYAHNLDNMDHNVVGDTVQGPVVSVSREEVLQVLNEMKIGKAPGPLEV